MKKHTILMVDDVELNHKIARDVLEDTYVLHEALSGDEAFKILEKVTPDLILLDIIMPEVDGFAVLKRLKEIPAYKGIPVIFLTADTRAESEVEGFTQGVVDYITKPFVPEVMRKRIETQIALSEYEHNLQDLVTEKVKEIEDMYDLMSVSFAGLVESRDGVTGGHLKNTSIYYKAFAEYLMNVPAYKKELSESIVKKACRSAPLHDVGKIAIEDAVLRKNSGLSATEFETMKMHSIIGGDIFEFIKERISDKEFGEIASQIARYHHERWDGKGYPDGLSGKDIPLVSRIMSIVDVYDALTSERPYKKPYTHEKSMALIVADSGTKFDPELVEEFVNMSEIIRDCLKNKENNGPQFFVANYNK